MPADRVEPTDWDTSAQAWIDVVGRDGDWGRRHVLDAPMLARAARGGFGNAIDIGCGEGRFCRMLQTLGITTTGIDPTAALIERARVLDPCGDYRMERAEALSAGDASFDLAVAYLSLIDIADLPAALDAIHRVLRPGGTLLIANLQGFNTASVDQGWTREPDGSRRFCIDHYLDERPVWVAWRGIGVRNWHRPLQAYIGGLLEAGFALRHFAEPEPTGVTDEKADRYRRVPNFLIMEWEKN
jgi:SAM-dependent methyltransferase